MNVLSTTSTIAGIALAIYVLLRWMLDALNLVEWKSRPSFIYRWWTRKL